MEGLFIGIFCFLMISVFHPLVKKQNCFFIERFWLVFFIVGIGNMIGAVFVQDFVWSAMLAIAGVMFLWSMSEFQEKDSCKLYESLHINNAKFLCSRIAESQNLEL
ncbi:MAG: DUF4491 family protein [Clostridium sp.]|nr:DUF4491 family protein [Clostridium sp.]